MKTIEIDDELYHYIASRTQAIGESASDILRRLLRLPTSPQPFVLVQPPMRPLSTDKSVLKQTKGKKAVTQEMMIKGVEKTLNSAEFVDEPKRVNRFLQLLAVLYRINPEGFAHATENVQGSERIYFAKEQAAILAHGSSVKAKPIPNSPFWVITNNNTERKGIILSALMSEMALPDDLIERVKGALN